MSLCLLLTNLSLFLTKEDIFMTSAAMSSWRTLTACSKGTERDMSLIMSRALMMMYGSQVFLVVLTVMLPSIRSISALMWCSASAFWTRGQCSFKYCSRYFGNIVAKELSSRRRCGLSFSVNSGIFNDHAFSIGPLFTLFFERPILRFRTRVQHTKRAFCRQV